MSTPAPALTAVRVIGITAVTVAVLVGAFRVATSFAGATSEESFAASGVRTVRVDVDAGRVDVRRGQGRDVDVDVTAEGTWVAPRTERQQHGGTLRLTARCGVHFGPDRCGASYRIEVPDGVDVEVRAAAARVTVDGIDGDVSARVNAGDVDLSGLRSSRVDVTGDVGRVAAVFAAAPDHVEVRTTTGSVEVTLPRDGEPYAVDARSDVGGASVEVGTDPGSPRTVVARTSVGSVVVRAG